MQMLYSLNRNNSLTVPGAQKNLKKSLDVYINLYHYILFSTLKVIDFINTDASIKAGKFLPTDKDQELSLKLLDNVYFKSLEQSDKFEKIIEKNKFQSLVDTHVINTLYKKFTESDQYKEYLENKLSEANDDHKIIKYLIEQLMLKDEVFLQHLEDNFPSWLDDSTPISGQIGKRLNGWKKDPNNLNVLYQKDSLFEEIEGFAMNLLTKTADRDDELSESIGTYLKNWDEARLALMDTILMKMALCELLYFKEIPVKVTINEYIDISKLYSTPKSKEFINGILDKLMKDLTEQGKIVKTGRGLKN